MKKPEDPFWLESSGRKRRRTVATTASPQGAKQARLKTTNASKNTCGVSKGVICIPQMKISVIVMGMNSAMSAPTSQPDLYRE